MKGRKEKEIWRRKTQDGTQKKKKEKIRLLAIGNRYMKNNTPKKHTRKKKEREKKKRAKEKRERKGEGGKKKKIKKQNEKIYQREMEKVFRGYLKQKWSTHIWEKHILFFFPLLFFFVFLGRIIAFP